MRPKLFYSDKPITEKEADSLAARLAKPSSTSEMSTDEKVQPKKAIVPKKEERRKEVDITI